MDGNGRWAQRRGRPRIEGHAQGAIAVRKIVTAARELEIEALTLYAFSQQNWGRPEDEVAGLMSLLAEYLDSERRTILDNDIRFQAIGALEELPQDVRARLANLTAESAHNGHTVLTLALSYGGREELVSAARSIAREVASGRLTPEAINEETIDRFTFTHDLPPLDLLVRTSGELRLSNFLLWQVAYAELVVTDVLWPDFEKKDLEAAIAEFQRRNRRYGKTQEQIDESP